MPPIPSTSSSNASRGSRYGGIVRGTSPPRKSFASYTLTPSPCPAGRPPPPHPRARAPEAPLAHLRHVLAAVLAERAGLGAPRLRAVQAPPRLLDRLLAGVR